MRHQIKQAVLKALSRLKTDDGSLFDCEIEEELGPVDRKLHRKLHEVCINHRLAVYLEREILPIIRGADRKYFVDIEFNRQGMNEKQITACNGSELTVRPDIIIHNRKSGGEKDNFLIVECKKKPAPPDEIQDDREKIRALMENDDYKYSFGLQVVYAKDKIEGTLFWKSAQAINEENISI